MFLPSLHKGRQTSKELRKNMNGETVVFLITLLIVFFIKKDSGTDFFPRILRIF